MTKLTDINQKIYARHLTGKACACIFIGCELDRYFGADNQFDPHDKLAAEQFLKHKATDEQKQQCQHWHELISQVRTRFKLTEVNTQALLEQIWLREEAVDDIHHALKAQYRHLTQPRLFRTQAQAKAYLSERESVSIEACRQQTIGINQVLQSLLRQLCLEAGDDNVFAIAEQRHSQRFQAWYEHCEQTYPDPKPAGMTLSEYTNLRNTDATCQALAYRMTFTECVQDVLGNTFESRMNEAAQQLLLLCQAAHIDLRHDDLHEIPPALLDLSFFKQPNWISTFVRTDGFDDVNQMIYPGITLQALIDAELGQFQDWLDDDIQHYLSHFTPLNYRAKAMVSVNSPLNHDDDHLLHIEDPFSLPEHLLPSLNAPMSLDMDVIKQAKGMLSIIDSLADMTGLAIEQTRLTELDQELAAAYQSYSQTLNALSNTISVLGIEDIAHSIGIDLAQLNNTVERSDYHAINVPADELTSTGRAWLDSFLDDHHHAQHSDELNNIVELPWKNLDVVMHGA